MLALTLGNKADLDWAQKTVVENHYLHKPVHWQARPMAYVLRLKEERVGLITAALPHATCNGGWWGFPGLPTQWQVVDLSRIWLDPRIQRKGEWCKPELVPHFERWPGHWYPCVASWAIGEVLTRVQRDRVSLWPPVYPNEPYHIELAISYHDPKFHKGTIYRAAGAKPMYTDKDGQPKPGPSGKYGWYWRLAKPAWSWQEIEIVKPRTMRLAFGARA